MKKLMNQAGLLAAAFALALAVALALNAATQTPVGATASAIGSDEDYDGLIEITTAAQLNAIRWDLDGNGRPDDGVSAADQTTYNNLLVCPPTTAECFGYELAADIAMTGTWTPIGGWETTLDGNGHFISGMRVTVTASQGGMFSWIGDSGKIRNLGLRDAEVTLNERSGGILVGKNGGGEIQTSYATSSKITYNGDARGADAAGWRGPRANVGGLVGRNDGKIIGSWADVNIDLNTEGARAGGLVGSQKGGKIVGSVAYGDIKITTPGFGRVGGFIGVNIPMDNDKITDISESYAYGKVSWDDENTSWNNSHPKTTADVFGCNAHPATLTNVYYNDESASGACSQIAGRTSP